MPQLYTPLGGTGARRAAARMIQPEFGFVARPEDPRPSGEARPQRLDSSRVHFAGYLGAEGEAVLDAPFEPVLPLSDERVQVMQSYSRFGWLAVVSEGRLGSGFRLCKACGWTDLPPAAPGAGRARRPPTEHKNPRTGKACRGTLATYALGHRVMSDILELHLTGCLSWLRFWKVPVRRWASLETTLTGRSIGASLAWRRRFCCLTTYPAAQVMPGASPKTCPRGSERLWPGWTAIAAGQRRAATSVCATSATSSTTISSSAAWREIS
jgi:hypothetical protein